MTKGRMVHIRGRNLWFFWLWTVIYDGNPLYNRFGVTLTEDAALSKSIRASQRIVDYEKRIGLP